MHYHLLLAYLVDHQDSLVVSKNADQISAIMEAVDAWKSINNAIVEDFLKTFVKECEPRIDTLDESFFEADQKKRWKTLATWSNSTMLKVLVNFVVTANEREVQSLVRNVHETFSKEPNVLQVSTPRGLDAKSKAEIRKKYPSGVVFQIDRNLVGGMHLYQNGDISDKSFSSLLSRISNLTV